MTQSSEQGFDPTRPADRLAQAAAWFTRLRAEDAGVDDLTRFQRWLETDSHNATAYARVSESWSFVGEHASAPEIMLGRRDALEDARRAATGRWRSARPRWLKVAAAAACVAIVVTSGLFVASRAFAGLYSTGVGERRTLTLADGSVVTLDAQSTIRVKYGSGERLILLQQGQARFDVAQDSTRPFRVKAGAETVIALGTQFNIELVAHSVLVTLIEGRVAVLPDDVPLSDVSPRIDLTAGEAVQVRQDGKTVRLPRVDVAHATAWQNGKVFFDNEPLASAAERINRYASERILVDPSAANIGISGVFNAGDARAFIEAVTAYFPVKAAQAGGATVRLTARDP
jgi:transmembrane sensor